MSDHNPYSSPNKTSSPMGAPMGTPMQEAKPASIKVFGVLNIVFGLMGVCGIVFSLAMLFGMPQNPNMPNPTLDLMQGNLAYRVFIIVSMGLGFVFVVIQVFSGIGLLQYRKYGRKLALWYGWYAIFAAIVGTVVNLVVFLGPLMEATKAGGPAAGAAVAGFIGGMIGGLIGLILPILLLVFMNRQNVKDALR